MMAWRVGGRGAGRAVCFCVTSAPATSLAGREYSRERIVAEAHNKAESLVRARSTAEAKAQTLIRPGRRPRPGR